MMYEIKRNDVILCSQPMEEKETFISMVHAGYKIYLDGKDITNKYKKMKRENLR